LFEDGLGQVYNGEILKGISFALFGWILVWLGFSFLMASFLGLIFFLVLSGSYKIYLSLNAFLVARKFQADLTHATVLVAPRVGAAALLIGVALFISSDFFLKRFFPLHAFKVPSASMCPTVCEGDRIVSDMRAFSRNSPKRGDVVMFILDADTPLFIKRVVAVGGDDVTISHGHVTVNGRLVETPASACNSRAENADDSEAPPDLSPLHVPKDKLFLIGDDPDHSYDSRSFGAVSANSVRGRPLYLYWSPQHTRIGCTIH